VTAMLVATSNFLVPNYTFFVELAEFLIVVFVLARYVLPRIQGPIAERQAAIRQALADAEEAKRRAAEAEEEYRRIISEARGQARSVVEEANRLAEQARSERRQQAEAEYERIVASAQAEIEAQTRRAREQLRREAADLAIAVAERVLGEGIDRNAQAGLIDRAIDEVAAAGVVRENA
jgi:F-type H+-transporting ATPase subunit b